MMEHSHNHKHAGEHVHSHQPSAGKNIAVVFLLNLFFVAVELVGGVITNSIAILSDALHDFGDCLSLAVAWAFQKKSTRKRDRKYSYGYKRFSLLGSVFLSGALFISSLIVLKEAFTRLLSPEQVNAGGMCWIAVVGIIINGLAALRMKKGKSLNERAVFLHIMEDVLGWIAVLLAGIVMLFADVPALDSVLSIGISLWVLYNVYRNLRSTFVIMLQATPENVDIKELEAKITSLADIISIHDLHLWTLDGESHIMTLHVVTTTAEHEDLKRKIVAVAEPFHIVHVTIETEKSGAECFHNCDKIND
jgi:cobalt-zinc-cadmium efflux system protein